MLTQFQMNQKYYLDFIWLLSRRQWIPVFFSCMQAFENDNQIWPSLKAVIFKIWILQLVNELQMLSEHAERNGHKHAETNYRHQARPLVTQFTSILYGHV